MSSTEQSTPAAVMFTDIALPKRNEALALGLLEEIRRTVPEL